MRATGLRGGAAKTVLFSAEFVYHSGQAAQGIATDEHM